MRTVLSFARVRDLGASVTFWDFLVLGLAVAVGTTSLGPSSIAEWALKVFGISFILLVGGLVFIALFSWVRYCHHQKRQAGQVWMETGLHAANGVSTVALTYTLLGISMGIGTLADQQLNPETVQTIIAGLTEHFSLAFLTSVIGLPLAAFLRALLLITEARYEKENNSCAS